MFPLILFSSCIFGIGGKPLDYDTGYRNLVSTFAKYIEDGKKVVVMNFTSADPTENKTTIFDSYLAQYFTTYLIETSGGRFQVIDRKVGQTLILEDLKYEVRLIKPEEILDKFKCDYYIIGKYILRYQKIEFPEISLMKGPIKVYSVSKNFKLTQEQDAYFKSIAQEDIIIKFGSKVIDEMKASGNLVKIGAAYVLERLLEEYKKAKIGKSELYEIAKKSIINFLLRESSGDK